MENKRCIYRNINEGTCCKNNTMGDYSRFCKEHYMTKNSIFSYISRFVDIDKKIGLCDILSIYLLLFLDEIENRRKLISYIFGNKQMTFRYAIAYGIKLTSKSTKKIVTDVILRKLEWHCMIFTLSNFRRKLVLLQRKWREYMDRISGTCYGQSINTEDIFSFEKIEHIQYPFSIKQNNVVFTFDVINLAYHFNINGYNNPYTKQSIEYKDVDRMYHYLNIKDIFIDEDEHKWYSATHAYTDLSLKLDSLGYYTDVRWFIGLRYNTILRVLNSFHSYGCTTEYMNDDMFSNVYPDYVYKFCRMTIDMLNDEHDASTYGFILYKSLADNSNIFHNNCPEWIIQ
jgi:hypothetical protein